MIIKMIPYKVKSQISWILKSSASNYSDDPFDHVYCVDVRNIPLSNGDTILVKTPKNTQEFELVKKTVSNTDIFYVTKLIFSEEMAHIDNYSLDEAKAKIIDLDKRIAQMRHIL